ncbi:MAG: alpha/beta fold hydrolase [Acutalibacteraceae bacterium]
MKFSKQMKIITSVLLSGALLFGLASCKKEQKTETQADENLQTAHVNGIDLAYTKTGQGKPFLLIHGNGEDHTIFDKLIQKLSKDYTVYAVDSRCHGASEQTETLSYYDMAKDMAEFTETVIGEKTIVYGFSDGGIIGLIMAIDYPETVSKLIASGANSNPRGVKDWSYFGSKIAYFFTRNIKTKMMLDEPDITANQLSTINIPTVILAGENDLIKESDTRFIADNIPNAKLEILKGENHSSYVVHSEKLYEIIKPYL